MSREFVYCVQNYKKQDVSLETSLGCCTKICFCSAISYKIRQQLSERRQKDSILVVRGQFRAALSTN